MRDIGTDIPDFTIRWAESDDVTLIFSFIRELAEYEKLLHEAVATEESLRDTLFGERKYAEVFLGIYGGKPAGFALFFHNYSTFLGKPGIYLEDLYVKPQMRGRGFGKRMLAFLAGIALERGCGRLEWSVLNWNEQAIAFYRALGAVPMNDWTVHRVAGENLNALAQKISDSPY